jgi:hypothetical protein
MKAFPIVDAWAYLTILRNKCLPQPPIAVDALQSRRGRLEECMSALNIGTVTKAQLWQAITRVARRLLA